MTDMALFDVAVIGGGVIGCAIVHNLTLAGYNCVLLEKNEHLIMGASSGNSGIYASGFDTEPSTLEGRCLSQACALNERIYKKYRIPRGKPGAIVVALNDTEKGELPQLLAKAEKAGIVGCRLLSAAEVHQLEPHITKDIKGGLMVPGERAVEPWLLPITLAHVAKTAGAKIHTRSEVISGQRRQDGLWELKTPTKTYLARCVINAAGLFGDRVEAISHRSTLQIWPRQGEYIIYDKDARSLVNHILLPVPTERTKGIILFPTVYNNLVVGPTAVETTEREHAEVSAATAAQLAGYAARVVPALGRHASIATYAGLRPATQYTDYQIRHHAERNWVTVAGIRSTGLSACLAIASHVHYLLARALGVRTSVSPPSPPAAPTWRRTGESILMDGETYEITHPISKYGMTQQDVRAKL